MQWISGLVTTSSLIAVINKIPSVNNLVKKTDYDTKINELEKKITDHNHEKYITTPEFNKLIVDNFAERLAQANIITKKYFDAKLPTPNIKIVSNKTEELLIQNRLRKLERFD